MARKTRSPALVSDCLYVAHCSPDLAEQWLSSRPVTRSIVLGTIETPPDAHLPEYILLRRCDPFIDLALARYGRSRSVLLKLYDKASISLRVVLAGNGSLFTGDNLHSRLSLSGWPSDRNIAAQILENGPLVLLRALVSNPDLPSIYYASMIEDYSFPAEDEKPAETRFPEDRFRFLVTHLGDNPRTGIAREDSAERHYMDGFADYDYNRFPAAAWNLAAKAPVTPEWAHALASLYRRLYKPYDCLENVDQIIDRWQVKIERYSIDPYRAIRTALAVAFIKPSIELLRSEDPARRDAFFRTFDPADREFADLDWNEFNEIDSNWSFSVYHNLKVWASPAARRKYRAALWAGTEGNSDLTPIGFWDDRAETLQAEHPEWFAEAEDASPPLARSEQIDTLRSEVRQLVSSMQEQGKSRLVIAGVFVAGMIVGLFF